jgi:hypothetical protein
LLVSGFYELKELISMGRAHTQNFYCSLAIEAEMLFFLRKGGGPGRKIISHPSRYAHAVQVPVYLSQVGVEAQFILLNHLDTWQ